LKGEKGGRGERFGSQHAALKGEKKKRTCKHIKLHTKKKQLPVFEALLKGRGEKGGKGAWEVSQGV